MTATTTNAYEHPAGTRVLVVGILGIVLCWALGPVAWFQGTKALDEIDNSPGTATNRSLIQAGRVCGIVGTVLLALPFVSFIATFAMRSL
jgi:hypothetical protein